jgi:hypothetical protein
VLTRSLDLSPRQATAAMRVSLATLRPHLARGRSALRAVMPPTPEYQPYRDRQRSPVSQGQPRCHKEPDRVWEAITQRHDGLGRHHPGRPKPASPPRSRPHRLARLAGLVRANVGGPGATRNRTHDPLSDSTRQQLW